MLVQRCLSHAAVLTENRTLLEKTCFAGFTRFVTFVRSLHILSAASSSISCITAISFTKMQSHRCVVAGRPARAAAAAAPCSLRAAAGVSRPSPSLWRNFETFFVSQPPASRSPLSAQQRCSHLARASLAPPLVEHAAPPKKRLAVFVSGGGSNFRAIHAACQDGRINGEVVVVVSDVPACGGMQYAAANGIPTLTYPIPKKGNFPGLTKEALVASLTQQHKVRSTSPRDRTAVFVQSCHQLVWFLGTGAYGLST